MIIKKCVIAALYFLLSFSVIYPQQKFTVDLSDTSNHLFKVTLYPEPMTDQNKIYQFAASAPGTYEIMDIGRFVQTFKAFDNKEKEITVRQISTNQWEISDPVKTSKVVYTVNDTWHSNVKEHAIYLMAGSNLENNNALINGQCVFGYFTGKQDVPVYIKINSPAGWETATALTKNGEGYYTANNYDMVVDSPILSGNLTEAETQIGKCKVSIYTFSKTGLLKSDEILGSVKNILKAEDEFIEGLPVDHYTFLFHFGDVTNGAWEHMYSSEYIYKELPLSDLFHDDLRSVIAHEFFHIVTPLNIHSQLIEPFNFVNPVMSQHLWFYEGTTEWAAWILQLRAGIISLDDYITSMKSQ
jgi:predicted metalloprotease with PDZ domain